MLSTSGTIVSGKMKTVPCTGYNTLIERYTFTGSLELISKKYRSIQPLSINLTAHTTAAPDVPLRHFLKRQCSIRE